MEFRLKAGAMAQRKLLRAAGRGDNFHLRQRGSLLKCRSHFIRRFWRISFFNPKSFYL